jgi:hypothetical protein
MDKRIYFKAHQNAVPKVLILRKPLMTIAQKQEFKQIVLRIAKTCDLPCITEELDIHTILSILERNGIINESNRPDRICT